MHLHTRNVNTAFYDLVRLFNSGGRFVRVSQYGTDEMRDRVNVVTRPSRNGNVLMIDEPVTVTYEKPRERVLFNPARDANPFFHLYEALWMLAGRNDVAPLAYYSRKMKDFSDDGVTLNGAYGYRWRQASVTNWGDDPTDQLEVLVNHLKADPNSRRAVLQMWNVEDDLLKVGCKTCKDNPMYVVGAYCRDCEVPGKNLGSRDVCCNLSVMFSLREDPNYLPEMGHPNTHFLDVTVTNRSNDLIWGLLGANYVHFSFLQEYMAARLRVEVGKMHVFTNNLHAYDWNWRPDEWLTDPNPGHGYEDEEWGSLPLVKDPTTFETELQRFVELHKNSDDGQPETKGNEWSEPFLRNVASPMMRAFHDHKLKHPEGALAWASRIEADDWRLAATEWLNRRAKRGLG